MSEKPEKLICDTSFVGHSARAIQRPERYGQWGRPILDRVEAGDPAVSIVTIAEVHAGHLWIAATASVHGHPLVTCDRDHLRIAPELGVEVVYLRPPV